jgi:hypothetical protein
MAKILKPLPKNQSEVLQEGLIPSYNRISKISSDTVFSQNRAKEISFKDKNVKDFSVSLEDHDNVIKYYFENTIKPSVIQNGNRLPVPILYGSPERWASIQSNGYYRDKDGKLMVPLIMYKRDTLEKNRSLGNKLDGNKVHNYQIFETRFNAKNQYDRFSVLSNRVPSKEYILSVIPDYVTLTYSCVIFTDYVEQINPIIEAINFSSDSYWGDFSRFKFRARIDSFTTTTEVNAEDGRAVKSTFNIVLNGYIIPDVINKQIANADLYYGTSQLIFNLETTTSDLDTVTTSANQVAPLGSTTIFEGGSNISLTVQGAALGDAEYLAISKSKTASSTTQSTAIFTPAVFANPPAGSTLPLTSKTNFVFYANGVNIPNDYVTSFIDNNDNTCTLTINTTGLGYYLTGKEITAIGKFQ